MGKRQKFIKKVILNSFNECSRPKLTLDELIKSKYYKEAVNIYAKLGGQFEEEKLPLRYGSWDISTEEFIIELDEERHFNRYRLVTLNSNIYNDYKGFSKTNYYQYCNEYENKCLGAASWGKNWKNNSTEKMFPRSNSNGELSENGSSRWRQRAYYDFLKDVTSLIWNFPIIRLSIYDRIGGKTVSQIIEDEDDNSLMKFVNLKIDAFYKSR